MTQFLFCALFACTLNGCAAFKVTKDVFAPPPIVMGPEEEAFENNPPPNIFEAEKGFQEYKRRAR